jgi:hypothetical protein
MVQNTSIGSVWAFRSIVHLYRRAPSRFVSLPEQGKGGEQADKPGDLVG